MYAARCAIENDLATDCLLLAAAGDGKADQAQGQQGCAAWLRHVGGRIAGDHVTVRVETTVGHFGAAAAPATQGQQIHARVVEPIGERQLQEWVAKAAQGVDNDEAVGSEAAVAVERIVDAVIHVAGHIGRGRGADVVGQQMACDAIGAEGAAGRTAIVELDSAQRPVQGARLCRYSQQQGNHHGERSEDGFYIFHLFFWEDLHGLGNADVDFQFNTYLFSNFRA